MGASSSARTYNQNHVPRKYTQGKRRISIYWTWSYPWEAQRDLAEIDNRFSTMTEVRRVTWPAYEGQEWSAAQFLQGIAGALELFHRSSLSFQKITQDVTGHPVAVFQRIDQAGYRLPVDERILADTDTLMVFGLDHIASEQEADAQEIAAIHNWLQREGTCLLLAPHHDVGFSNDLEQRQMEYLHHGDALVPRQQRFGQYTRSLMKALDVPVRNRYGLRPALVPGTKEIAPLTAFRDIDSLGLLKDVPTLISICICRTTSLPAETRRQRGSWRVSRSISTVRTLSPRPALRSSTACCGCHPTSRGPETSFLWTPRTS